MVKNAKMKSSGEITIRSEDVLHDASRNPRTTKKPASAKKRPAAAMKRPASAAPELPAPHPAAEHKPLLGGASVRGLRMRLSYASDCSGLDGGALALKSLGLQFQHLWASEVNANYRTILEKTHPECATVYPNVCERLPSALDFVARRDPEQLLIYMAGFPCQPYSPSGARRGALDSRSRPLWAVLLAIDSARPDVFLLENVPNFAEDARHRDMAKDCLQLLMGIGHGHYYVDYKVLDAYTHGAALWLH